MLTVNINIQDRLINGQTGIVRHIAFIGSAHKVYEKLSDKQVGSKVVRSSYADKTLGFLLNNLKLRSR